MGFYVKVLGYNNSSGIIRWIYNLFSLLCSFLFPFKGRLPQLLTPSGSIPPANPNIEIKDPYFVCFIQTHLYELKEINIYHNEF